MTDVHIRQVLAQMDIYEVEGKPSEFSIEFVKTNGELRRISRCAKGYKSEMTNDKGDQVPKSERASDKGSSFGYNHKQHGTVLVRDLDNNRVISIKISGIIKYNGHTVKH
jgi:hypothetical protein